MSRVKLHQKTPFPLILLALITIGCSGFDDGTTEQPFAFAKAPGIIYLASYGSQNDIDPPSAFKQFVIGRDLYTDAERITRPYGVAVAPGKVYVSDGIGSSGYWELDLKANKLTLVGHGRLKGILGMDVDERGFKYIAAPRLGEAKAQGTIGTDKEEGAIIVFDAQNRPIREINFLGRPIDVAVGNKNIFVTDFVNKRVVVFDKHNYKRVTHFGKAGRGEGEFSTPKNISLSEDGFIFVGDTFGGRIKVFDSKGKFVSQYGYRAAALGGFLNLAGLGVDKKGRVYAVDSMASGKFVNNEIQVFDSSRFYKSGEKFPAFDSDPGEKRQALFGYFEKPYGLGDPSLVGQANPMYRSMDVAIDYQNGAYFQDRLAPGDKIEYLIWLTSQSAYSGKNLTVFAYLAEK